MDLTLALLFILVLLLFKISRGKELPENYPKGPPKLPIFGHLLEFLWRKYARGQVRNEMYADFYKPYGPVYSLQFGPLRQVVITDFKLLKQAYYNLSLCGRPRSPVINVRTGGVRGGILFHDGPEWREQRRFTLRHLRNFGLGTKSMEPFIVPEVREVIERLKALNSQPTSTNKVFHVAVINALWKIVSGSRFPQDDPGLDEIFSSMEKSKELVGVGLFFYFPWVRHVIPELSGWNAFVKEASRLHKYIEGFVGARLKEGGPKDPAKDFTDAYLNHIESVQDPVSSFYKSRGQESLKAVVNDLFVAGTETTATSLSWFCLYMAAFPEVQERVRGEVTKVLGKREARLTDRDELALVEATIMESNRYSSFMPTGVFHYSTGDTCLGEWFIPKNTLIIPDVHSIHHDPSIWGDPETFRPERFLSQDGRKVIKPESYIIFSMGRRTCIGESLAKEVSFLFAAEILREFVIEIGGEERIDLRPEFGNLVVSPRKHQIVFKVRE